MFAEQTATPANTNANEQKKFNIPERENTIHYDTHICAANAQVSVCVLPVCESAPSFLTFYPSDVKKKWRVFTHI